MVKKFELIKNDYINFYDTKLYRIRALIDFDNISAGDLGGYIEKEENLAQEGNAWVYDKAFVFDDARVYNNAQIRDGAWVHGNAVIYDNATVYGYARVYGNARVYGSARVFEYTYIYGNARVYDNAIICGNADIFGDSQVYYKAKVHGNVNVYGEAEICGDAIVAEKDDYIVFKNAWSSGRYFTYTKSNKMWRVGCFYGTGEELVKKAYKDSEKSGKHYELYVNLVKEMERMENEVDWCAWKII